MKRQTVEAAVEEAPVGSMDGMRQCPHCSAWLPKGAAHTCPANGEGPPPPETLHARVNGEDLTPVLVPLADLYESPRNPRQYYPEGPLQELADRILNNGFHPWRAIIGRPRQGGGVEVGAGHRRRRAAIIAGLSEVPVIVRNLTDEQFDELLNFDNGGNEDVHQLHEAAGWRNWMRDYNRNVADICARTGKSQSQVYKQLKYLNLIEAAQHAFLDGTINSDHARLLCHRSPSDQAKALRAVEAPFGEGRAISARELKAWMAKNLDQSLAEAPFDRGSAELVPEAGSCVDCPHRLGNSPDYDPASDIADVCTRPECYQGKLSAHVEARKAVGGLVLISEFLRTDLPGVIPVVDYSEIRSEHPDAKPALIVEGKRLGHEIRVLVQEKLPIEPPAPVHAALSAEPPAPKPKKQAAPKPTPEQEEAERVRQQQLAEQVEREERQAEERRLDAERKIAAEKQIRKAILQALLARITKWPPQLADVKAAFGNDIELPEDMDDAVRSLGISPNDWQPQDTEKLSDVNFGRLLVLIAVSADFEDYTFSRSCESLDKTAKRYGVNVQRFREVAKEKEGGTRKEVLKKLPALNPSPASGSAKPAAPKPTGAPAKKAPAPKAKKAAPAKKAPAKKGGKR